MHKKKIIIALSALLVLLPGTVLGETMTPQEDTIVRDERLITAQYEYDNETDDKDEEPQEVILEERDFRDKLLNALKYETEKSENKPNKAPQKRDGMVYGISKRSKVYRQNGFAYTSAVGDVLVLKEVQGKYYIYSTEKNAVEIPVGDFTFVDDISVVPNLQAKLDRQDKINTVVSFALSQLNKPYVWGDEGPSSYDCSGLTMTAYRQIGVSIPRTSYTQCYFGERVRGDDLRPGDLVFFRITESSGHVGMYLGEDRFIHSPKPGDVVKISKLSARKNIFGARRILPVVQ